MRSLPFLASAALLVAHGGCGTSEHERRACLNDAYRAAQVRAVVRLYDEGKLGSQELVESELSGPTGGGPSFFEEDGDFIPFEQLDLAHKNQFIAWMTTGRVGELSFDARKRARANADPDC